VWPDPERDPERPKTQSAQIIDTLFELIKQSLQNGEDVLISEFGRFSVKEKQARTGRNPQTGKSMTLSQRKVVTFKCSRVLRKKINGQERLRDKEFRARPALRGQKSS
jgi:integration host factor subunit alpha